MSEGLCSIWGRRKDVGGNHNEDTTCQPLFGCNPFKITSPKGRRYLLTLQIRNRRQRGRRTCLKFHESVGGRAGVELGSLDVNPLLTLANDRVLLTTLHSKHVT